MKHLYWYLFFLLAWLFTLYLAATQFPSPTGRPLFSLTEDEERQLLAPEPYIPDLLEQSPCTAKHEEEVFHGHS